MKALILFLFLFLAVAVSAQTTEFIFQGQLHDSASPANGSYDFEFLLFDSQTNGMQIGATLPRNNINVTTGVFSSKLDFGAVFPGAKRFLEIHVKHSGDPAFTVQGNAGVVVVDGHAGGSFQHL